MQMLADRSGCGKVASRAGETGSSFGPIFAGKTKMSNELGATFPSFQESKVRRTLATPMVAVLEARTEPYRLTPQHRSFNSNRSTIGDSPFGLGNVTSATG